MPDISQPSWSETDAANTATPPDGWPENQAPSTVNDCARQMMGAIKRFWNRINPAAAAGGAANAYVLTPPVPLAAYVTGEVYSFRAGFANTGPATLDISGRGAKAIRKFVGGTKVDLAANDIGNGQPVQVAYDGTDMVLVSPAGANTLGLSTSSSGVTVSNTTAETTVCAFTVPANTLGAGKLLRLTIIGDLLKNDAGDPTIRAKLGATTFATINGDTGIGNSATVRPVMMEATLVSVGASAQRGMLRWSRAGNAAMDGAGDAAETVRLSGHNNILESGANDLALAVTFQWSAASPGLRFRLYSAHLELIG